MQTLVIITGISGAGKTLQLEMLEQHYGQGRVLTIATRAQREREADNAYHFISDEHLTEMESRNETIWVIGHFGSRYSVTKQAIQKPLRENKGLAFVAISPDYHAFLAQWCRCNNISPINIHLLAPDLDEQIRRLRSRDGKKFNPERIEANIKFETDAQEAAKKVVMHFIKQSDPENMFAQIRKLIDSTHAPS